MIVTFGWSLPSGACYFWEVVSFEGLLLLDGVIFGWSFLSGGRYYRVVVAFGWSLLSGGRYFRVSVIFGVVVSFGW